MMNMSEEGSREDTTIPVPDDAIPRAFVESHHYRGSYPTARWHFGLHCRGELVGVAVFSVSCDNRMFINALDVPAQDAVGRFALLDEVSANGKPWFLEAP